MQATAIMYMVTACDFGGELLVYSNINGGKPILLTRTEDSLNVTGIEKILAKNKILSVIVRDNRKTTDRLIEYKYR